MLNELKLSMENIEVRLKTKTKEEESLKALLLKKSSNLIDTNHQLRKRSSN